MLVEKNDVKGTCNAPKTLEREPACVLHHPSSTYRPLQLPSDGFQWIVNLPESSRPSEVRCVATRLVRARAGRLS